MNIPFLTLASSFCNLILFLMLNRMRGSRKILLLYTGSMWFLCSAAFVVVSRLGIGNSPASFFCYALPSFFALLCLSQHRGFRFIFNFCMADVINLLISTLAPLFALLFPIPHMDVVLYLLLMCGVF